MIKSKDHSTHFFARDYYFDIEVLVVRLLKHIDNEEQSFSQE